MSFEEFNHLSENIVPVLVDARPFGKYSMVDIDEKGGVQVFVKDLLDFRAFKWRNFYMYWRNIT